MAIGASKLNEEKVEIIKELLKAGNNTHQQIADIFGVSRTHISHINQGRRWNDDNKSFAMKSNDFREYYNPYKPKNITKVTITYDDGRKVDL